MRQVTINIVRRNIYHIAEGISAMISQHNGGKPAFEQLWASPDEAKKLDIYYREAISDLEQRLVIWGFTTTSQYDLTGDADDFSLTLLMSPHWPERLKGLLDNKMQDYLVHAVTAGWLNDFAGLDIKQDYQAMASQDLDDIISITMMRSFDFHEEERVSDGVQKDDPDALAPEERKGDDTTKEEVDSLTPDARIIDGTEKDDPDFLTPEERKGDNTTKESPDSLNPDARKEDTERYKRRLQPDAGLRKSDNVIKKNNDELPPYCRPKNLRHRDNDIVEHPKDWTDWSGTGIAYGMQPLPVDRPAKERLLNGGIGINQESERLHRGRGFTPSTVEKKKKDVRIPDNMTHPNYPHVHTNGLGWSDKPLYDIRREERYINRDCCDGTHEGIDYDGDDEDVDVNTNN